MYRIYQIVTPIEGCVYIGVTTQKLEDRLKAHLRLARRPQNKSKKDRGLLTYMYSGIKIDIELITTIKDKTEAYTHEAFLIGLKTPILNTHFNERF